MKKLLVILTLLLALLATTVPAAAREAHPQSGPAPEAPEVRDHVEAAVVGMASMTTQTGEVEIVSIQAWRNGDRSGGNFRCYMPGRGYYNGGVRSLRIEGDTAILEGGGGYWTADGRTRVHFRLTLVNGDPDTIEVEYQGRELEESDFLTTAQGDFKFLPQELLP